MPDVEVRRSAARRCRRVATASRVVVCQIRVSISVSSPLNTRPIPSQRRDLPPTGDLPTDRETTRRDRGDAPSSAAAPPPAIAHQRPMRRIRQCRIRHENRCVVNKSIIEMGVSKSTLTYLDGVHPEGAWNSRRPGMTYARLRRVDASMLNPGARHRQAMGPTAGGVA
jgi:hypothetical protein